MATQEELDILNQMNEALAKQVEYRSKQLRLQGDSVDKQEEEIRLLRAKEQQATIALEYLKASGDEVVRILESEEELLKKQLRKGQITKEQMDRELALLRQLEDLKTAIAAGDAADIDAAQKKLALLEEQLISQKKVTSSILASKRATEGMVSNLASLTGFKKDLDDTLFGSLLKGISTGEGFKATIKGIGTEMSQTFGPANALQFLVSNSIQVAQALDGLQASFVSATGASREFAGSIEDVFRANAQFGVGLAESANAVTGLRVGFGAFSNLSKASQDNISGTAALLEKLGVSVSTTGNNFEFLVSQLGFSVGEAESTIRDFTETGASIGIPPEQLNSAFQSLAPRLSAFGKNAPKVFMETAKTAKSLGMTVDELGNTLFALSDSMDTFSESANVAATTNLALGGSFVNAFDLTMAAAEGPTAQVNMLRDAFDAAGKSLGDMNFFEQKFFADAFGVSLSDLTQVIDGNMSMQEAQAKANPLEELATKATSAIDKLNKALKEAAVGLQPLIGVFTFLVENIRVLGPLVIGLTTAFKGYTTYLGITTALAQRRVAMNILDTTTTAMQTKATNVQSTAFGKQVPLITTNAMAKETLGLQTIKLAGAETIAAKTTGGLSMSMKGLAASVGLVVLGIGAAIGFFVLFDGIGARLASTLGPGITAFLALGAAIAFAVAAFTLGAGVAGIVTAAAAIAAGVVGIKAAVGGFDESSAIPDSIPGLAVGGFIASEGVAMVGEQGPELVTLPKGAQVTNNQSTTEVMKKIEQSSTSVTNSTTSASESAMLQALLRIEKALGETQTTGPGTPMQPINVSVKLDKKKVGEATVDYINKTTNVFQSN